MWQLIIRDFWAVGMHHHGPKKLTIGEGYQLKWEENNPFDVNATAVVDNGKVFAYLKRENAFTVAKLIREKYANDKWHLKPKEEPIVLNKRAMPKKAKGVRSQYDPNQLEMAVNAVKTKTMSMRKAAQQYAVPKSTISDRISGRVDEGASPGKRTVFTMEVENLLCEKVKEAARQGFGISRLQLALKAARLARNMHLNTPFKGGIPGKDWVDGLMKRHQDISLRSPTPLCSVRARMLNTEVTRKYFSDLAATMEKLNLGQFPDRIWNIDETHVSLTHKPSKVLAEKGQRNVPGRVGNSREGVTVLACVNALGKTIPPLTIVKGKTHKALNAYNLTEGPTGTKYTYQQKAWMEDILGITWFTDHFLKHCGPARPQMIILDSHSSHETLGLLEKAKENNITLFALPPHTTQYLNPLDKTMFGPFQRESNRVCTEFMNASPNSYVTKWKWPRLFNSAYEHAFTEKNIKKGFEVCGIFPINQARIPGSAFAPSIPFDNKTHTVVALPINSTVDVEDRPTGSSSTNEIDTERNVVDKTKNDNLLATADNSGTAVIEAEEAEHVLQSIMLGNVEVIEESQPSVFPVISDVSWNMEIDSIFQLPSPVQKTTTPANKRKKTCHRILTSDEAIEQKRKVKEDKENALIEREQRKLVRQAKSKSKTKQKTKVTTI